MMSMAVYTCKDQSSIVLLSLAITVSKDYPALGHCSYANIGYDDGIQQVISIAH